MGKTNVIRFDVVMFILFTKRVAYDEIHHYLMTSTESNNKFNEWFLK